MSTVMFEPAEPRDTVPGGYRVEAGYLTVPEARSAASGWRLAVVDLPLEIGELLLQPIDLLRQGLDIVLRPRRRRAGEQDGHRQTGGRDDKTKPWNEAKG